MVGTLTDSDSAAIQFGDEGQQWCFMTLAEFLSHPNAVPRLQQRLRDYVAGVPSL
jgi:8-oxo-dGTP diphosphatase